MITIDYFSDILCVWAYGGQVRLEELQREFGEKIIVRHRFMPLFADTQTRIGDDWDDRGGFEGFGRHMQELCAQWEHTRLSSDVWTRCRPSSCTTAHVFLKAASLCLGLEQSDPPPDNEARLLFERLIARTRLTFFEQARDISDLAVLLELLAETPLSADVVCAKIDRGEAYAALHRDQQQMTSLGVSGSPTYVFNEGRQLLYGNVGYRIIEANIRELMSCDRVEGEPSWC